MLKEITRYRPVAPGVVIRPGTNGLITNNNQQEEHDRDGLISESTGGDELWA